MSDFGAMRRSAMQAIREEANAERERILLDMARQLDELAEQWSWHTATGIRLAATYVRGQASDSVTREQLVADMAAGMGVSTDQARREIDLALSGGEADRSPKFPSHQ